MEYIDGKGFIFTIGDTWKRKLHVLQLVNHQGAWIDEVSIEGTGVSIENFEKFIPVDAPYRILLRESTETILDIKH